MAANGAPEPKLREFTVAGIFEAGLQEHDGVLVFASLEDVRALAPNGAGQGLRIKFDNVLATPERARAIAAVLPPEVEIVDWSQDHASYFRAIRIEKTMMALILLLVVTVAAFNLVAMLVMVVTDKRTDIAILRTLGAAPRKVMGAFLAQGLVIGWMGVVLGVALGVTLALNVGAIVPILEQTFHFQIMSSDVYYVTQIPSDLHWNNVLWISLCAMLLTALATVYPALRASRVEPAEALRYE
jgi:lipoprotein-releasing system permease protein